ncbi:MAG: TrmH family RNA methyltransferase [Chitinophagaceae bacterium]
MTPERKQRIVSVFNCRQPDITVVLENITDPHNISAVMRTCDAIGITEVFVLNTKIIPHQKFSKNSSSSALKWVLVHQFTEEESCFKVIRKKYDIILSTFLGEVQQDVFEVDFTKKIALVFGNEKEGVSPEIRKYTDGNFVIPQVGMIKSLNISVACAVCLYEAFRQKRIVGHYNQRKLSNKVQLALMQQWNINESIIMD